MLKIYQLRLNQNTFDITLKYKGVGVHVSFTDGNTYNGTKAKFYTRDPFKQKAIEASKLFQDKDIILERTVEEESDRKPAAAAVVVKAKRPVKTVTMPAAKPAPAPEPVADDGMTAMTFENVGEAILYVAQQWGQQATNEKEVRDILKEHGIKPTIKRG